MFEVTDIEGVEMDFKTLITEKYRSYSGRKLLTGSLCNDIEKAAAILRKKYKLDAVIAENMDDFKQSFMIYLIEHESIWSRSFSFESLAAFFKMELDYFIGEQTEKLLRNGYRTLARWTRDSLRSDNRFNDRQKKNRKQRVFVIFGLSRWIDEKPVFGEVHNSFLGLKEKISDSNVFMTFDPVTQTKPDFDQLVSSGNYESSITDQIRNCSEVLLDASQSWCSVAQLISGFRDYWLELKAPDEQIGDDVAVRSADLDDLLYSEAVVTMKEFIGQCSYTEFSILKALLSDDSSGKIKMTDVAKQHGVSSSTITDQKKKLFLKLSKVLSESDEQLMHITMTALIDLVDTFGEVKNESL